MIVGTLFWSLLLLACGFAATAGGKDGRWAVLLLVGATLLTIPALLLGRAWHQTEYGILLVDTALLTGLYALSLKSRRFFPVWMTGFQLVAVLSHVATLLAPHVTPRIYQAMETFWSIPVVVSMVLGIALDLRAGIRDPATR